MEQKENMNLIFYDFNNPACIPEEEPEMDPRSALKSQGTDR